MVTAPCERVPARDEAGHSRHLGPHSLMLTTWNLNLWSLNAGSDPHLSFFPQGYSGLNCVSPKDRSTWNVRMWPYRARVLADVVRMWSWWVGVALNPVTGILVRGENTHTQRRRPPEDRAEMGVMCLQTKGHQRLLGATRRGAWHKFSLRAFRRNLQGQQLHFGRDAPKLWEISLCCLKPPVCGHLLQ